MLLDESGQLAEQQVAGKIMVSWRGGCKKTTWGAEKATATTGLKLPPAKVRSREQGAAQGSGC